MTKYYHTKPVHSLLLALLFSTFCKGQVKVGFPKDSVLKTKTLSSEQPKIIKMQGANQYANIRCGLQDKNGKLWFGTMGEGVYCFDGKRFTQFTVKEGLSSNTVWSILEDKKGDIWFGTEAGLCRYNGKLITTVPFTAGNNVAPFTNLSSTNNLSTTKSVWSMLQDKNGTIWLGTSEGVYCCNGTSFTRFLDNNNVINKSSVYLKSIQYLFEDKNGNIWFGPGASQLGPEALEGLCRYDGKSITRFKPNGDGWIRYIVQDKTGMIWFGTRNNGNWQYDGKTFTQYTNKAGIGAPVLVDKEGNIWFSGEEHNNGYESNGGIWRYDGTSFKNFTTKDGIGKYSVWSIIQDRKGNIWFGTRNIGLYRYDGKTFTSFSE